MGAAGYWGGGGPGRDSAGTASPGSAPEAEDFPDRYARTGRFRFGVPHAFTVSPDGERVVFLRSGGGRDPANRLWVLDIRSGAERLIADPAALLRGTAERLPAAERVRRERVREGGGGIVAYATDRAVRRAVFTLSGRVWRVGLAPAARDGAGQAPSDGPVELAVPGPAFDPRLDPAGARVAYVRGAAVMVASADGSGARELAAPDGPDVSYGLAEHVAAEEMGRARGFWWSPDGSRLLVARVDNARVQRWYIADPADPSSPGREIAYPSAGTPNADVSLWIFDLDGCRTEVRWDRAAFEYLVAVSWDRDPLAVVQSRDQRTARILRADAVTGAAEVVREDRDPAWVRVAPGVPAVTGTGALVWIAGDGDTYRLMLDGTPVTPPGLQVCDVLDVDGDTVLMTATAEPERQDLWAYRADAGLTRVTTAPGVHVGRRAGDVTVIVAQSLDQDGTSVSVHRDGRRCAAIAAHGEPPGLAPRVRVIRADDRELRTAVLFPSWHEPGSGRLPVLMDPYGGPGFQRVVLARGAFTVSQWFAEQGFAVVVADGRGTPARGLAWERAIRGDIAGPVLEDQITALHAAADRFGDLDLGRVGIRGWSFGGFLAALAVLRRPDLFHAAVAGAAVSDQRLYDTYWKERFLGLPGEEPGNYDRCSLLAEAAKLERPLMLIHGLADDNVVAAHALRLSAALLAAGRPHVLLPLPGATHMVTQADVNASLLRLQLEFLRRALGVPGRAAVAGQG